MNMIISVGIYIVVKLIAGCLALHAMIRFYINALECKALVRKQILDQMVIEPAQKFSLGSTTLAGSRADDDRHPECTICISEFVEGEEIKVLPRCKHGFHAKCIEKWLLVDQSSCPTCRASCKKSPPAETSQQQQEQLNDVVDDIESCYSSGN